jgi:hypothetical protein
MSALSRSRLSKVWYGSYIHAENLGVFTANLRQHVFNPTINISTTTIDIKIRALSFDAPW